MNRADARGARRTLPGLTSHDRLGSLGRAVIAAARKLEANRPPRMPARRVAGRRGQSSETAG
jgi:hypothetical protein